MSTARFLAVWMALAVVLTSATELRSSVFPIGPGEALLAGWILFAAFLFLRGRLVATGPVFRALLLYWLTAGVLLGFGTLMALTQDRLAAETAPHDTVAFLFAALLTCFLVMRLPEAERDYRLTMARTVFFTTAIFFTGLLLIGMVAPDFGGVNLWYGGVRFAGWARNPNQTALYVVAMPFLGWYLLRHAEGRGHVVPYLLAILGCVWVGLMTGSDGLRVAWSGTLFVLALLAWYRALLRARGPILYLSHLLVPVLLVVIGFALGGELWERFVQVAQDIRDKGHQGQIRFAFWQHGLEAIQQSPLVGFGPGAYSGPSGPFGEIEAHNSLIDWGMSSGILGIALHLVLLGWCGLRAWRIRSLALLGVVGALTAFSATHYTLRQPIYWLLLLLVLLLTERPLRVPAAAPVRPLVPPPARPAWHGTTR